MRWLRCGTIEAIVWIVKSLCSSSRPRNAACVVRAVSEGARACTSSCLRADTVIDARQAGSTVAARISMRARTLRHLLRSKPRSVSAAFAAVLLASLRHDRAAHRSRAEGDEEGGEQQDQRNAGCAVGEDQLAQMSGVESPPTSSTGADRKVDGEQAEQGNARRGEGPAWGSWFDMADRFVLAKSRDRAAPASIS